MQIPESYISELKSRCNIQDVIGRYTTLKRAGSNMVACCPFHSEKTPSFTVFNSDHFYCFGCGAGGDVITFIMKIENLDYISALETLSNMVGMKMPENDFLLREKPVDKKRFLEMNRHAALYFHDCLKDKKNSRALSYLLDRGLTPSTIKHFGLGFAPESWNSLTDYLSQKGYTPDEMKTAFLVGRGPSGNTYDYFRDRIIFPIIDLSGNVIAFGGRLLSDGKPKYLNTSDTPVFKKSRNLYALNIAKNNTTSSLILCEGYMDVIALHQAGFGNAVATLGTAITGEQARLISRYAKTVYICYDADDAGRTADKKAISLLKEVGVSVKVVKVNNAKDPDEFIKKYGRSAFEKLLQKADGHIMYAYNEVLSKYNLDIPEEKLKFSEEICSLLADVYSPLEREIYIQKFTEATSFPADVLRREIQKKRKAKLGKEEKDTIKLKIDRSVGYRDEVNRDKAKYLSASTKEENILGIILLHPEYLEDKRLGEILTPESFVSDFNRRAFEKILEIYHSSGGFDIAFLSEDFTSSEIGKLIKCRIMRGELSNNTIEVLFELCDALKREADKINLEREPETDDDFISQIENIRKGKGINEKI